MPSEAKAQFGMIGMAVMGRNLALNILDHDYSVAGYNREPALMQQAVEESGGWIHSTATLVELVQSLERPRRIMMMIKAGKPVDIVLDQLAPLLEPGDVVIDGGNSWYQDTRRREAGYADKKLQFLGVGVSGGEEGARDGPSLMPGGHRDAYQQIRPIFEAIAAKTDSGACVTHVGSDGAGHFVKMVHNGIEYADMQNIAGRLGIPIEQLRELAARPNSHYRPFTSRKRKKPRRIDKPDAWLKGVQRVIRKRVLVPHPVSESARACVKGGSPLRHARAVTGNQDVAETDLKNCFPSITNEMAFKLYRSLGFGVRNASVLTKLSTWQGHLPQGAPTSDMVANLVLRALDERVKDIAESRGSDLQSLYGRICRGRESQNARSPWANDPRDSKIWSRSPPKEDNKLRRGKGANGRGYITSTLLMGRRFVRPKSRKLEPMSTNSF